MGRSMSFMVDGTTDSRSPLLGQSDSLERPGERIVPKHKKGRRDDRLSLTLSDLLLLSLVRHLLAISSRPALA